MHNASEIPPHPARRHMRSPLSPQRGRGKGEGVLMALACFLAAGAGSASPGLAEIDSLVADLGDPEASRRDAAHARLLAIGDAAGPSLARALSGDDAETRHRAAGILKMLGTVPDDAARRIRELVADMESARDPKKAAWAWSELLSFGWMSADALETAFPEQAPPGVSCAAVLVTREVSSSGLKDGRGGLELRVENTGKTPVWISTSCFRIRIGREGADQPLMFLQDIGLGFDHGSVSFDLIRLAPEERIDLLFLAPDRMLAAPPGSCLDIAVLYRAGSRSRAGAVRIDMDAYMRDISEDRPHDADPAPLPPPPTPLPDFSCTARVLVKP